MRNESHKYAKNEYIIHCSNGICIVEDIGALAIGDAARDYYTLKPFWDKSCKIFVPTDSDASIVRRALTKKDAKEVLSAIPSIEAVVIEDEKKCKDIYSELLKENSCQCWISIIKTIQQRRLEREAQGKTLNNIDERYLKKASELLFGELAVSLDITAEEIETCVLEKLHML